MGGGCWKGVANLPESQPSNAAVVGTENPLTVKAPPRPRRWRVLVKDPPPHLPAGLRVPSEGPPPKAPPGYEPPDGDRRL